MSDSAVLAGLPHRRPFLFVDRIIEATDDRIVTTTRADPQADFFAGHYPGNPVMPGVLVCECAFQAGALLMARRADKTTDRRTPVLTRIKEAKFKRIVRPGDLLEVEVQLDEELGQACFMTGRVTVAGKPVLRVTFACAMSE
ncbi:MAG: beta-hydroxyacyl-ACP dehydratase [Planctomycetes bacterium]|nr:beta-hydroxyacyl-ACP dehydratase [Planctomycetota bacterium]